jgi:predicted RNA binding protein YcfA (HicA-like mRNA interferase family)
LPELPKLTAKAAEKLLFQAGFELNRVKGSHYIYMRNADRVVVPYHAGKILHPKIVKQILDAIATDEQ